MKIIWFPICALGAHGRRRFDSKIRKTYVIMMCCVLVTRSLGWGGMGGDMPSRVNIPQCFCLHAHVLKGPIARSSPTLTSHIVESRDLRLADPRQTHGKM